MKIIAVKDKKEMRDFVEFPRILYGNDPCYVPPIWIDERKAYYAKNNPILANSDFQLFLAADDNNKTVGRVIAYIDHNHNKFYKVKMGFFGAFECVDNTEAGGLLVNASEKWLKEKGMEIIRGPIHPAAENWGFVYKGYDSPPVYMSPWNLSYYHRFFTDNGYEKAKDLLVYDADISKGYVLPERYNDYPEKFMKNYPDVKIRRLDMKNIKKDARSIWEISNLALADNWGYVPLELSVMEDMLRKLKMIVDPDAVWIIEDGEKAIGYCLGFPDINIIIKKIRGKLFPCGWIKLLTGVKKLKDYRLFGLAVHPDWQGKALDAIMYINLYRHLLDRKIRMEANYILEDNLYIKNALEKLGMKHIKTYRIYEKKL
jgi:ribosomal protein S18 acetylase RimI-like enzyme